MNSRYEVIKFEDILPNPYRNLEFNPLREDKLQALVESIKSTDLWGSMDVRPSNTPGKYQLAYGHHRFEAAKRAGLTEAGFCIKNLDNAQMILRMDQENREEYRNDVRSVLEAVRGAVEALSQGQIPAFEIAPTTKPEVIRYAPSFVPGRKITVTNPSTKGIAAHPYTILHIARVLKRTYQDDQPATAVIAAMNALYLLEIGAWTEKDLVRPDKPGRYQPSPGTYKSPTMLFDDSQAKIAALAGNQEWREEIARIQNLEHQSTRAVETKSKAEAQRIDDAEDAELKKYADAVTPDIAKKAFEAQRKLEQKALDEQARDQQILKPRKEFDTHLEEVKQKNKKTAKSSHTAVKSLSDYLDSRFSSGDSWIAVIKAIIRDKEITLKEREHLWEQFGHMLDRAEAWRNRIKGTPPQLSEKTRRIMAGRRTAR